MNLTLGLDVGGTKIAAVVLNGDSTIVEQSVVPTDGQGTSVIAQIWDLIDRTAARHSLDGVGVAVPGNVAPESGTVISAPNIGWNHVDLQALIAPALPKGADVVVVNDANAAWSEYRFGEHQHSTSFAMITVGTGIGGGAVVNGQLLTGAMGAGAEIGHLPLVTGGELCFCGSRGCWERYASGSALNRAALENGWGPARASHHVLESTATDQEARRLLGTVAGHMVQGLELVSSVLDPATIVLRGGLGSDPTFFGVVSAQYSRRIKECKPRPTR
jgi:glucokinase